MSDGRYLSMSTQHGVLHVDLWSDEGRMGDLFDQGGFRWADVLGLRAESGDRKVTLTVHLTCGHETYHATEDLQFWSDFNDVLYLMNTEGT